MINFNPGDLVKLNKDVNHWNNEASEKYSIILYPSAYHKYPDAYRGKLWVVFILFWKWERWDNPSQILFVAENEIERVE